MKFNVLIGGKAGEGIEKSSTILAKSLVKLGFYSFVYREFGSYIKGGSDFSIVSFSEKKINSHDTDLDAILAFNSSIAKKCIRNLKQDGVVICGEELKQDNVIFLNYKEILKKLGAPDITKNSAFLGMFFKVFNLPIQPLLEVLRTELGELNEKVALESFKILDKNLKEIKLPDKGNPKIFMDGTSAVGLGAIYSGLDFYFAYPMTPSTKLLHFLSSLRNKHDIKTFQLESEISVVNASIGANFGGSVSMVGTSGGGFDLMAETLSFQGMTEIPLVVYLAQRSGPSTGIPTYHSQSDLNAALYSGHGYFPRVVVAPGDPKEAFEKTVEAFYLSFKYNILSIILSDKHLAESYFTFEEMVEPRVEVSKFLLESSSNSERDFKTYEITENGVSQRAYPDEFLVKANSYEHDEKGFTTTEKDIVEKMQEKRVKKFYSLKKEVEEKFETCKIFGEGENLIVSFGSNKGVILDALNELKGYKFLHVIYLSPLPEKIIAREMEKAKRIFVVENDSFGQFKSMIDRFGGDKIVPILKYDGRPFSRKELIEMIKVVK
ncbi:MAG: 2-oxoacid:acceptor oxidoreductase subunit alpha [Candidatus Aenigmarchaeota archaeon]|nr:2-oxoacid:acceptor oxidoreductase subunit alpha [Candidatus Aenigmarchaeota archaeon]MDW8159819.1 2-oxoacid:acceptor oxidoreductase subunit alpha [Candidatus Aenigmarchaeota archaeon]